MATWSIGEVPPASKFQALDDRVTAVENLETKSGYTGAITVGSSGQNTITHGLGSVPTSVVFALDDANTNVLYAVRLLSKTSTQFVTQTRNTSTGAAATAGQPLAFYWTVCP